MSINRCLQMGYQGELWPVHPSRKNVAGLPCFSSLEELPGVPDAAFIGINRELTVEAVKMLSEMGVGGCVCYCL